MDTMNKQQQHRQQDRDMELLANVLGDCIEEIDCQGGPIRDALASVSVAMGMVESGHEMYQNYQTLARFSAVRRQLGRLGHDLDTASDILERVGTEGRAHLTPDELVTVARAMQTCVEMQAVDTAWGK